MLSLKELRNLNVRKTEGEQTPNIYQFYNFHSGFKTDNKVLSQQNVLAIFPHRERDGAFIPSEKMLVFTQKSQSMIYHELLSFTVGGSRGLGNSWEKEVTSFQIQLLLVLVCQKVFHGICKKRCCR